MVSILIRLSTLALGWAAFTALAQPPADAPTGPSQQAQSPESPPAPPAEPDDENAPPSAEDDDVFIPTEEIPADEEVTFPVNI